MKTMHDIMVCLINAGFVQRTTVLFQKGNVAIKFIDGRGIRISIVLHDDMELTMFSTWDEIDFSKLSAL